jgi:hypothetical protein
MPELGWFYDIFPAGVRMSGLHPKALCPIGTSTPLLTRGFWIMQQRNLRFEVSIIEKGLVNDQKMPAY